MRGYLGMWGQMASVKTWALGLCTQLVLLKRAVPLHNYASNSNIHSRLWIRSRRSELISKKQLDRIGAP